MKNLYLFLLLIFLLSCNNNKKTDNIPTVAFLDAFEDATISQAKVGFFDALKSHGFSEDKKNIKVLYRNAQGDIPTLTQACDYFISENVDLIATNTTLSTITAVQKTKQIPVFMMVSPSPQLANLIDKKGNAPKNLYGVFETLEYIDTSVVLIKKTYPAFNKIGVIFNQSEPQSMLALNHLISQANLLNINVEALPANNSSETQLVVESLINKNIDAFFALPDNTVFASFEVIFKSCSNAKIPIFTSEAGLVKRGALMAFGADIYQWGYQAGEQAAKFLKTKELKDLKPEIVKIRKRVYNPSVAKTFQIDFQSDFTPIK